ncbi:MAG: mandelate racemase/muconate lactonizing enzyme family protein [Vicinamibacterales bacterium]|nr:mandelate racemase/muconate lactonizing enzyme family protein [Vicinamibacterales bacterium]
MDRDLRSPSRRRFLQGVGGLAAMAAGGGAPRQGNAEPGGGAIPLAGMVRQSPPIRIRAVDAYPVYINQRSDGLLDPPSFSSDDDPRRWRYGGPFEQLPSAIIAVIKTDQGITGFGMGAGGSAAVEIIDGHLKHLLVDANPLNVEQLWDQMYSSSLFYGRRGLFTMALSAVDNALWDIAGKHAGQPVYQLLGGQPRDRIAIYQSGGNIPQAQAEGIRHFKLFPRVGPETPADAMDRTVDQIVTARQTMGPEGNLMIDCVSRTGTVEWAVDFAERVRPANLYFMEELLSPDDVFGYAELVRRIGGGGPGWTKVACGEHEYTEHGFEVLTRLGSAEVLQPDMTWCGGVTAGRRIARLVESAGLEIIPHRGGSLWGLPIALTSPSCTMAESFPAGSAILDAMTPRSDGGDFLAPEAAGFGTTLTEALVLDQRLTA